MENDNVETSPYKSHFFIIGIMMLIGGSIQTFMQFQNETDPNISRIVLHSITALGGIAFLIVAFQKKNKSF